MKSSIINWLIAIPVCTGAAYLLWYKFKDKVQNRETANYKEKNIEAVTSLEQRCVSFPKENFLNNVRKFTGSFEPLYNAVNTPNVSLEEKDHIYSDWCLRLQTVFIDTDYAQWAKEMSSLALNDRLKWLLQEVISCGIVRDNRTEFIIDENNVCHYLNWDGTPVIIGDKVKAASAAWSLNGECIEKGIITQNNITL